MAFVLPPEAPASEWYWKAILEQKPDYLREHPRDWVYTVAEELAARKAWEAMRHRFDPPPIRRIYVPVDRNRSPRAALEAAQARKNLVAALTAKLGPLIAAIQQAQSRDPGFAPPPGLTPRPPVDLGPYPNHGPQEPVDLPGLGIGPRPGPPSAYDWVRQPGFYDEPPSGNPRYF